MTGDRATPQSWFTEAVGHHQAGRLAEADRLYRQLLAADPRHPGAQHMLGMLALAAGRPADAVTLIARGIECGGARPAAYEALGKALELSGRFAEAIGALRQAVALDPGRLDSWYLLGLLSAQHGDAEEAIDALGRSGGNGPHRVRLAALASALSSPAPVERAPPAGPLNLVYRISDGGYAKPKLAGKQACLRNCLAAIGPAPGRLTVIADNCGAETLALIAREAAAVLGDAAQVRIHRTSLGNGPSWIFARDLALGHDDAEAFYFVEDDYLHRPGAGPVLIEGLARADYVSLYDHPDKYLPPSARGNPLVSRGGEVTRLIRTQSTHWKFTTSTTMTFAVRVGTLRADRDIFDRHTGGRHPFDFRAFIALVARGRTVLTPVPSWSTHAELGQLAPLVDWEAVAGGAR